MSNLPKSCYYPSVFAQVHSNGEYSICCGGVPPAGNYKGGGSFKEYWNSEKFKNLANLFIINKCHIIRVYLADLDAK